MLDSRYLRYGFPLAALVPVALMFPLCVKAEPLPTNEVPPLEAAVDPYAGVGWATVRQSKANLHTHSTQSDGSLAVPAVIDAYHALGYEVLAMTDHNLVTWPWTSYGRDPGALGMVAVQGNELSRHHHANSLFCGFTTSSTNLETSLTGVAAAKGIVLLNHPAMHWPASHPLATATVRVPMAPALRALGQGDFTVETWFRTTKADRNILMGNYSTSYSGSLTLELHTENRARVYFQPTSGTLTDLNISATTLGIDTRDGQWHHLAAARTGTTLRLFLDGQLLGEAAAAQPGFDLQGEYFYLGRDTRTGSTQLVGALDQSRLWARALAPAEIAALAAGSATAGLAQGATGLLAEYRFETSGGTPVAPAPSFTGTIDDSAGHPQGPFHASASGGETLAVTNQVPAPLLAASQSQHALQFAMASGVPASALAYYRDLFLRHPVMFGMEVLNGTRPLSEYTLDRNLWDGLLGELMPHRPVWGIATDDMHSTTHLGRDWAVLLIDSLDEATVRACLENGRYYFSSTRVKPAGSTSNEPPPRIDLIAHDSEAGRMTLSASVNGAPLPASAYQWISHGQIVHTGPVIDYRADGLLPAGARYLRAEIQGEGGITLTNPIGFAPAPNDEEIHAGDLREGLVAYYDFEETGTAGLANKAPGAPGFNATRHGGGVFDSSAHPSGPGFSGNATFNPGNGESDRSELMVGNALNLVDTRADAIIVPLAHTNLGDNFTISVWHALTPSGGSVARPFVFEQADNNYNISWGIGSGDSYTAYVTAASAVGAGVLARDAWHHAAHVFESDGTTTTLRLYLNGQLVGTRTGATTSLTFNGINFGRARNNANGRDWDGMMDEIGVWSRALDASEVFSLHNLGQAGQPLTASITTHIKADNTIALSHGESWDSGNPPAAADFLVFNSDFTQAGALDTGAPMAVAGLRVGGGSGLIDINNPSGILTPGNLGIDLAAATRDLRIANLATGDHQNWNIAAGRTLGIGGLSGAADVTKLGAGQLLLDGANAHGGTLAAKGGLTTLGAPSAIPATGMIAVSSGAALTLRLGGGLFTTTDFDELWDNNLVGVNMADGARAGIDSSGSETVGTALAGPRGLAFSGGGTLTLTGDNSYGGGTSLFAGTLRAGSDTALGTGPVSMENGTKLSSDGAESRVLSNSLSLTGDVTLGDAAANGALTVGAINLQAGARLVVTPSDVTVSGVMSNGGFTKTGAGTMTLTAAADNNLSDPVTASAGTLLLGSRLNAPAITAGPGTLIDWTRDDPFYAAPVFELAIHAATVGGADRPNYYWGTNHTTIRMNQGTLKLGGTATGANGNDFLAPVFRVTGSGTSAVTYADGNTTATLRLRNLSSMTADVDADATLLIATPVVSSDAWDDTSGARSGGLTKTGAGNLVLTGNGTYTGTTTISEGSLQLGDGGATGSPGPGAIVNNATLEIIRSDALALANIISGSGTLAIKGGGTVTLTGPNTYTGDTSVENGTLVLGSDGQLSFALIGTSTNAVGGPGEAIFNGAFRLDLTAAELADGTAWTLVSAAVRTYGATFSLTSNAGPFGKSGGVHTLFSGGRTWTFDETTGVLKVNDGLILADGASLKFIDGTEAGSATVTLNGGNLWLGEAVEVTNDIVLVGPAAENVIGGTLPLDYLVVGGGGGGGGRDSSGGGGGGGVVSNVILPALGAVLAVPGEALGVFVGDGGAGGGVSSGGGAAGQGADGQSSFLAAVAALGGGGGGSYNTAGKTGASGGGGGRQFAGGSGTADQGKDGGAGSLGTTTAHSGGGGGGSGAAGAPGIINVGGGKGGDGLLVDITGTSAYYAGGGGGTPHRTQASYASGSGGQGGGGGGATASNVAPQAGTANTGGGGGASRSDSTTLGIGGKGGSGIVIVRYPGTPVATGGAISAGTGEAAGHTIHSFTNLGAGVLTFGAFAGTASATISGTLGGSGGFTWNSTGSLTLTAANTYRGDTVVNGGTLVLHQATLADGSSVFLNDGATLNLPHGLTDTVAALWINGIQQPAGTYHSGNTGGAITGTGSIRVGGATAGFAAWIGGFFPGETDPAIIGPDADPNGDGVANALVYLFGGDPKDGNNLSLLPTATLATSPGGTVPNGNYLVFTYRRDTTANVTASVGHSTTLTAPWSTAANGVGGVVIVETPNGFASGIDKVEVFLPRSGARMFCRLGATVP